MPLHIAAMNKQCAKHTIHLLVKDCPHALRSETVDGSLPIHLACQYSSDPSLIAALLYYDKFVVNQARHDTFTPLHLVAARGNVQDVKLGLIKLDQETQLRMIRVLLDHGADTKALVEEVYKPVDLLDKDRSSAKACLEWHDKNANLEPLELSPGSNGNEEESMPSPYSCHLGSVATEYHSDSDSDNCSPDKMAPVEPSEDFDLIAKVLFKHPTIQAVLANDFQED